MKDSGIEWIGEIPVEWEIRKIFRAINKVGDIDHYMPDSVDDGIPYLMTGDLQEKLSDVNLKSCKKVSFQDYEILSTKIKVNKLVLYLLGMQQLEPYVSSILKITFWCLTHV